MVVEVMVKVVMTVLCGWSSANNNCDEKRGYV